MQGEDQWRVESRDADGEVTGRYVYKTPDGQLVDISYNSGHQGYRAVGDAIPGGAAPPLLQDTPPKQEQVLLKSGQDLTNEELDRPYGALSLLLAGLQETHPTGQGVFTYTDQDRTAIVIDVYLNEHRPVATFPIALSDRFEDTVVGPPQLDGEPVLPAALEV